MPEAMIGQVHGKTVTLDREVPDLEGQRVRVMLEPVGDADAKIAAETQAQLWQQWTERGPQGPLTDDGDDEFP